MYMRYIVLTVTFSMYIAILCITYVENPLSTGALVAKANEDIPADEQQVPIMHCS